jgi:hypothetical protein
LQPHLVSEGANKVTERVGGKVTWGLCEKVYDKMDYQPDGSAAIQSTVPKTGTRGEMRKTKGRKKRNASKSGKWQRKQTSKEKNKRLRPESQMVLQSEQRGHQY